MSDQDGPSTLIAPPIQLNRQQIMSVTARCLAEVGYDQTTIRKIASELGCAIGSIYRYFKDKRELLYAVTQQRLEPVADVAEAGGSFEASIRMYQQRAAEDPQTYRLMFWLASLDTGEDLLPGQTPATPENRELMPAVIRRIVGGWARSLQDVPLARQCWSLLHGSIMLGIHSPATIDALLRMVAARKVARQAATAAHAVPSSNENPAVAAPVPVEQTEDVCML